MIYIAPYNMASESARNLALSLGVKRITGDKLIKSGSVIINWGNSSLRSFGASVLVVNTPRSVSLSSNKIESFNVWRQAQVSAVESTTDYMLAFSWWQEGYSVYCRTLSAASEGRGIHIADENNTIVRAPLYTKGVLKAHEYRVHVFNSEVIDYTKKRRRQDVETNPYIKNFNNGWVFCRENVSLPEKVRSQAVMAVNSLGLNFGAVDVLYRQTEDIAYILEVNSAPGIEGTTLEKYRQKIRGDYAQAF